MTFVIAAATRRGAVIASDTLMVHAGSGRRERHRHGSKLLQDEHRQRWFAFPGLIELDQSLAQALVDGVTPEDLPALREDWLAGAGDAGGSELAKYCVRHGRLLAIHADERGAVFADEFDYYRGTVGSLGPPHLHLVPARGADPDEFAPLVKRLCDELSGATGGRTQAAPAAPPIGRNQPCPCGSGRKFKRCHWDTWTAEGTAAAPPDPAGALCETARALGRFYAIAAEKCRGSMDNQLELAFLWPTSAGAVLSLHSDALPAAEVAARSDREILTIVCDAAGEPAEGLLGTTPASR